MSLKLSSFNDSYDKTKTFEILWLQPITKFPINADYLFILAYVMCCLITTPKLVWWIVIRDYFTFNIHKFNRCFYMCLIRILIQTRWHWSDWSLIKRYRLVMFQKSLIFAFICRRWLSIWVVYFDRGQFILIVITLKFDWTDRDIKFHLSESLRSWPLKVPLIRTPQRKFSKWHLNPITLRP